MSIPCANVHVTNKCKKLVFVIRRMIDAGHLWEYIVKNADQLSPRKTERTPRIPGDSNEEDGRQHRAVQCIITLPGASTPLCHDIK